MQKAKECQKNIYFCFIDYAKAFDIVDQNNRKTSTSASLIMLKLLTLWIRTNWKIFKETGVLDNLTCLLRNLYNLYAGQEAS